jgi:hypothetical protein
MTKHSQDSILLLRIPMRKTKNLSENYRQFAHALSKRFASPAPDDGQKSKITFIHTTPEYERQDQFITLPTE